MKKVLIAILVLSLILSTGIVASATNINEDSESSDTTIKSNTNVEYLVDIPESVDFGTLRREAGIAQETYDITASYVVLEPDCRIYITAAPTGILANALANDKTIEFTNNRTIFSITEECTQSGTLELDKSKIKYAGNYSGTLTFNISYRSVYELVSVSETHSISAATNIGTTFDARYDVTDLTGDLHFRPAFTFDRNVDLSKVRILVKDFKTGVQYQDLNGSGFDRLNDCSFKIGNGPQLFSPRDSILSGNSDKVLYVISYNGAYVGSYTCEIFVR